MLMHISSLLSTAAVILLLFLLLRRLARNRPKLSVTQKKGWMIAHAAGFIVYFTGVLGALALVLMGKGELAGAIHRLVEYFDWFLIIPGALTSLLTGFWLSLRTPWGVVKYWWVIAKWAVNIGAILYGSTLMRMWIHESPATGPNWQLLLGTVISLSILVFLMVISYLKPWGQRRAS